MKNEKSCPSCGASLHHSNHLSRTVRVDYYQSFGVQFNEVSCDQCGYSGSVDGSEAQSFELQKKASDEATLKKLIDEISTQNSATHIERVLGLPQRTLNRWKSQGGSSSALALVKLVRTYGWLLNVAEIGYEPEKAKEIQCYQTAIQLSKDRELAGSPYEYRMEAIMNDGSLVTLKSAELEKYSGEESTLELEDFSYFPPLMRA